MEKVNELELPGWLREALERGLPTDNTPDKRAESRRFWANDYFVQPEGRTADERFVVHGFNVCENGVGFSSLQKLPEGQHLFLSPGEGAGKAVRVRVIHCTPSGPGTYKIGCMLVPS